MATAATEIFANNAPPAPPALPPDLRLPSLGDEMLDREVAEGILVGLDRMRTMSHDELRDLIRSRIAMLDGILVEREQRRAAHETAKLATAVLESRRRRSVRIKHHVDRLSAFAAVFVAGIALGMF